MIPMRLLKALFCVILTVFLLLMTIVYVSADDVVINPSEGMPLCPYNMNLDLVSDLNTQGFPWGYTSMVSSLENGVYINGGNWQTILNYPSQQGWTSVYEYRFYGITAARSDGASRDTWTQKDYPAEYVFIFQSNKPLSLLIVPSVFNPDFYSQRYSMVVAGENTRVKQWCIGRSVVGDFFNATSSWAGYPESGFTSKIGNWYYNPYSYNPNSTWDTTAFLRWTAYSQGTSSVSFVSSYFPVVKGDLTVYGDPYNDNSFGGVAGSNLSTYQLNDVFSSFANSGGFTNDDNNTYGLDKDQLLRIANGDVVTYIDTLQALSNEVPDPITFTFQDKTYTLITPDWFESDYLSGLAVIRSVLTIYTLFMILRLIYAGISMILGARSVNVASIIDSADVLEYDSSGNLDALRYDL